MVPTDKTSVHSGNPRVLIQSKENFLITGIVLSEAPITGGEQERITISAQGSSRRRCGAAASEGFQDSLSSGGP